MIACRVVAAAALALGLLQAACRPGEEAGSAGAARPASGAPDTLPPSILLVLVDALRPDHLGCYGYTRPTSPVLDDLAAESVVFKSAYAVSSWTKPSVPSLFTSLYPSQHGVFEGTAHDAGGAPESDVLPGEALTLAEALQGCGYATAAFVHNAQLRAQFGFAQGFDIYEERGEDAASIVLRFLGWLRERPPASGPFFAYLHLLDAHWPYDPPGEAARLLGAKAPPGDDRGLRDAVNDGLVTLSRSQLDDLVTRYDAEIRGVDGALGRLLTGLGDLDLRDDLVLMVTSDHGEGFLEHGALGHGSDLYEESLRIPLILRLPRREGAGRRISARVSSLDIMPTFLDLAGCLGGTEDRLEGRSLLPYLTGDAPRGDAVTVAEVRHKKTTRQAIWRGGWKLIRTVQWTTREAAASPPGENRAASPLVGRRFEVEGSRLEDGRFIVSDLALEGGSDDDDEITGVLEAVDLDRGTARLLGFTVEMSGTVFLGPDGKAIDRRALKPGLPVKVEGWAPGPGRFLAEKVRLLKGKPEVEIEGVVRRLFPAANPRTLEMEIAGLRVLARRELVERAMAGAAADGGARRGAGPGGLRAPEVLIELFDLRADPGEMQDLSGRDPERVRSLLADLEAWEKGLASRRLGRADRAPLDTDTVERLRSLGYIN